MPSSPYTITMVSKFTLSDPLKMLGVARVEIGVVSLPDHLSRACIASSIMHRAIRTGVGGSGTETKIRVAIMDGALNLKPSCDLQQIMVIYTVRLYLTHS